MGRKSKKSGFISIDWHEARTRLFGTKIANAYNWSRDPKYRKGVSEAAKLSLRDRVAPPALLRLWRNAKDEPAAMRGHAHDWKPLRGEHVVLTDAKSGETIIMTKQPKATTAKSAKPGKKAAPRKPNRRRSSTKAQEPLFARLRGDVKGRQVVMKNTQTGELLVWNQQAMWWRATRGAARLTWKVARKTTLLTWRATKAAARVAAREARLAAPVISRAAQSMASSMGTSVWWREGYYRNGRFVRGHFVRRH